MRELHPIFEVPKQKVNPFIGLIYETSLAPEIIMSCNYQEKVSEILKDENYLHDKRGSLICWFYLDEIMPNKKERLELVHIACKNEFYKDLDLYDTDTTIQPGRP